MAKLYTPAAERNADPIADVLAGVLPGPEAIPPGAPGRVLEIASGSGQHVVRFASRFPNLVWQPSERSTDALASIEAWRREAGLANLRAPLELDVERQWPSAAYGEAIVCVNLLHIAPWSAAEALFAGAAERLPLGGPLVIYGPFNVGGSFTSEGNRAFDADLRGRDPQLGLRDVERVEQAAAAHGLSLVERVAMPANNLSLILRNERRNR